MSKQLSFFVAGLPVTQAGMRQVQVNGFTRMITTGGKGLLAWRTKVTAVAVLAKNQACWEPLDGPVIVSYRFLLPMPAARPAAHRNAGIAPSTHKPDLDKLTRAIGDSLSDAKVYTDDARVFDARIAKYEIADHRLIGVEVVVAAAATEPSDAMLSLLARRRLAPRSS